MGRESPTQPPSQLIDRRALLGELRKVTGRLQSIVEVLEHDLGIDDKGQ